MTNTQLLVIICVAVLSAVTAIWLRAAFFRFQTQRRFRRGRVGEQAAAPLLEKAGFTILEEQASRETGLWIDDQWQDVVVRADYLVERKSKTYVVEVKTGNQATNPASTHTRRQLFEYHHVYHADGLILADMEEGTLHTVRFPTPSTAELVTRGDWLSPFAALLMGFAAGALFVFLFSL